MGKIGDIATEYATLKQAARAGQLSRRDLVRRGIALGLGGPALAGLLMSYRGSEARAQAAEPAGPRRGQGQDHRHDDPRYRRLAAEPPWASTLATELFKPYAKETLGYDVNFSFEEAPFDQLFQKAAASLSTGAAEYNIIISDSQWLGALAEPGWIVQLNDIIAANPSSRSSSKRRPPSATASIRTAPTRSGASPRKATRSPSSCARISSPIRPSATPSRPPTAGWTCPRPSRTGKPSTSTASRRSPPTSPGRTRPLRHELPVVEGLRLRLLLHLPLHVLHRRRRSSRDRRRAEQRSRACSTPRSTPPVWPSKSFVQYAPEGVTNYGIAEEVDVFTAGTLATCFQWSALGPQMINRRRADECRASRLRRTWC